MTDSSSKYGTLFSAKNGVVRGNAHDLRGPGMQSRIEVFAGGISLGGCEADGPESSADGSRSFELHVERVPPELKVPYEIRAQVAAGELDGRILVSTTEMHKSALQSLAGQVTGLVDGAIEGWALRKTAPGEAVDVVFEFGGNVTTTAAASRAMPASSEHGGGHGFRVPLPASVLDGIVHNVRVSVAGDDFELAGSPFPVVLVAVQSIVERLEKLELGSATLRSRVERQEPELMKRIYGSLGADLAKRMDAIAVLQRDAFEREFATVRHLLSVPKRPVSDASKPASAEIVFDKTLVGYGWYGAELHDGLPFQWMGASATAIVDFTSRDPATLEILGLHVLDAIHLSTMRIMVNSVPVTGTVVRLDLGWRFEGAVPMHAFLRTPFAIVTIDTDFARQPSESDARDLSVAVRSMRLSTVRSDGAH